MQRLLLVDMDGVLCAYNEKLIDAGVVRPEQLTSERWKDSELSPEHKEKIRNMISSPGFFADLKPIEGAISSLQALLISDWNVYLCSRPPKSRYAWNEKYEWVLRHCPFLSERLILTTSKSVIRGDVFIDDSLQALKEWCGQQKILLQTNPMLRYECIPNGVSHFTSWPRLLRHLQDSELKRLP